MPPRRRAPDPRQPIRVRPEAWRRVLRERGSLMAETGERWAYSDVIEWWGDLAEEFKRRGLPPSLRPAKWIRGRSIPAKFKKWPGKKRRNPYRKRRGPRDRRRP